MSIALTSLLGLLLQLVVPWTAQGVPECGDGTDGTVRFAADLHDADAVVLAQRIDSPGPGVKRYFVWKGISGARTGSVKEIRVYRDDREEPFRGLVLAVLNRGEEGVFRVDAYEQQPDRATFADPGMFGSLGGPFGAPPSSTTLAEVELMLAAPAPCRLTSGRAAERRALVDAARSADVLAVVEPHDGRHVVREVLGGKVFVGEDVEVPGLGDVTALVIERGDDVIAYETGRSVTSRTWLTRSELCGSLTRPSVPRRLCVGELPAAVRLDDVQKWLRRTTSN